MYNLAFYCLFRDLNILKSMNHRETIIDFGFKDVGELVTQEWYGRILEDKAKDRKIFKNISTIY